MLAAEYAPRAEYGAGDGLLSYLSFEEARRWHAAMKRPRLMSRL